ncbi:MAG: zf-HC2 domain-containing protein [Gemmatimonadota bacterium]|nr:zf-HC2 domain-containing protein [Gemmatimonadota bacterium]
MLNPECRQTKKRMHSYLDGELSPMEERAMRTHLARCGDCAPAFERLQRSEDAVRSHFAATVVNETAPTGFWDGLSERLNTRPERVRWRPQDLIERIPRGVLAPVAVVAVLMLAVWGMELYETAVPAGNGRTAPLRKELAQIKASILDMEAELEQQWR